MGRRLAGLCVALSCALGASFCPALAYAGDVPAATPATPNSTQSSSATSSQSLSNNAQSDSVKIVVTDTSPGSRRAKVTSQVAFLTPPERNVAPTYWAAVTFDLEPKWHIYWINPGDSGIPTTISWQLPPGWTAGELMYPLPKKFTQPGDMIGYGYEDQATFLVQLTPPKDFKEGTAQLAAQVTYLVCDENNCIPGKAQLSFEIPAVLESSRRTVGFFDKHISKLPKSEFGKELLRSSRVVNRLRDSKGSFDFTIPIPPEYGFPEGPVEIFPYPSDEVASWDKLHGNFQNNIVKLDMEYTLQKVNQSDQANGRGPVPPTPVKLLMVLKNYSGQNTGIVIQQGTPDMGFGEPKPPQP